MRALQKRKAEPKGSRDERVFLSGDLVRSREIRPAHGFEHLPTDGQGTQVSDRWRQYRGLAVSYLCRSGDKGVP